MMKDKFKSISKRKLCTINGGSSDGFWMGVGIGLGVVSKCATKYSPNSYLYSVCVSNGISKSIKN